MCHECEWENVLEQAGEMVNDDSLSFAFDTIESIRNWIENNQHVTQGQQTALNNIQVHSKL